VQVRVTDNGIRPQSREKTIELILTSIEIEEIPKQTIEEGRLLLVPIQAKITGEQQPAFTYRLQMPAPEGSRIDPQTGEFQWTAPQGSAGTVHNVTVEVSVAANSSLRRTGQFQIEVTSLSPTDYWGLPILPTPQAPPQEVVLLKDPAFAQKFVSLKLLGFDGFSERVFSRQPGNSPEVEAIYRTPQGAKGPPEQRLGRFAIKGQHLVFQWDEYTDRLMRQYQHILREAVLQVRVEGQPISYYALKQPVDIPDPLELAKVLSEPYREHRIQGLDDIPVSTSRNWTIENVQIHFNGIPLVGTNPARGSTNHWSFPQMANNLGLTDFQLVFEEKPDGLVWRIDTNPSLRQKYNEFDSLLGSHKQAVGKQREAFKDLRQSENELNGLLNNGRRVLPGAKERVEAKIVRQTKALNAETQKVNDLTPKVAAANDAYQRIKPKIDLNQAGHVTLSVYRMVEGVKLHVLTVR
jgi:hypothetical protein